MTSTAIPAIPPPPRSAFNRYLVVTAVATPANLIVLAALLGLTSLHPLACNLLAATVVTVPTFAACNWWVWQFESARASRALAFWTSSLINVLASSGAVWLLANRGFSGAALAITPLAVYTALWFGRYVLLDRIVFVRRHSDRDVPSSAAPTTENAAQM